MAELKVVEDERPGILKEIDEGAMDLIFQAIQEDIYSFPIKSFVRESISNGLDSIVERQIFEKINAGEPVEDYFLQRQDGKLLKDSGYNPAYYDKNYLSFENIVEVKYTEDSPRDMISIKDKGVGLGGSRLKGFFKLGYSSKRNMKDVIGKFGAGAKAGLATGVEYFTMHTTYNGFRTSFMIYKNDYDPITEECVDGRVDVWDIKLSNGSLGKKNIYWEPTNDKNSVTIELEVKKHNKDLFLNAVTSQFQYFNGRVKLLYDQYGEQRLDSLNSKPEYESDVLLIPRYSTYNSPHILVDGISYGVISWDELELDRRQGKIAIKVAATDVDITQSRESLKWTEKTKKTILDVIAKAKTEAEDYISTLLNISDENNLFEINNIYGDLAKNSADSVTSTFSRFLDMHNIKPQVDIAFPKYIPFKGYMSEKLFDLLFSAYNVRTLTVTERSGRVKINTTRVENFQALRNSKIIFAKAKSVGPKLAQHLLSKFNVNSLIYIRPKPSPDDMTCAFKGKDYDPDTIVNYTSDLLYNYGDLYVDTYDVDYDEDEVDEEVEVELDSDKETLAQLRKANEEVLYTTYSGRLSENWSSIDYQYHQRKLVCKRNYVEKSLAGEFPGREIIICTGKMRGLGKLIEITQQVFNRSNAQVIYVAEPLVPLFAPHGTVITDYFRQINPKTGELMIGEHIRDINTWRIYKQLREDFNDFSSNDKLLEACTNIDMDLYKSIDRKACKKSPREIIESNNIMDSKVLDDVFAYLESLRKFQDVVKTADEKKIAATAQELFNSDEIYSLDSYDVEFIDSIKEGFNRLAPIAPVLALFKDYGDFESVKPFIDKLINALN